MTLPVRDFVIQRLLEFDPNFDVGSGVPTTGLMIDPLSVILQPIVDELTVVQASQSILTILASSDPDSFPEDIVDGLASNAFVERKPGAIGSDVERIRFFQPQAFSAQKGVLIFRGSSGQRYTNAQAVSFTAAEVALNQEGSLYFVDVPIVALDQGAGFNVDKGGISTMEATPIGVANVTNLFAVTQGLDKETNTQLIDRIKVAVTVRALVTGRGIVTTLTENFTTIEEITPIGFHAPEMMRDIVYNVHIGGNVDVYVKTPPFPAGSFDAFGLEIDTTRRRRTTSTAVMLIDSVPYSLNRTSLDRTDFVPVATNIDGFPVFVEGVDYSIDDVNGTITRLPGGSIFHVAGAGAVVSVSKRLTLIGAFAGVRPGMILTVDSPADVAGTYTVKARISNDTIEIYGEFSVASEVAVDYQIDENVAVTFEYNPVAIDIIKAARTLGRALFTITDTPVMYVSSVEVLDPLSGDPTGTVLNGRGGFGAGGFGMGGFGVGDGMDYQLIVATPTLEHSWQQDDYIEFSQSLAGTSVRVNYLHAPAIPPIQAFMDDRDNQSETASLLARHYIPVYVDTKTPIIYDIAASTVATALSVDAMTTIVVTAIDAIAENHALEISDLVDLMFNNGATRVDLGTAEQLRGEIHNQDGTVVFALPNSSGDIRIPSATIPDPTDAPLSPRIARFRSRNILLTRNVV